MSKPYVTVLINAYNEEKFIEQTITSSLEQDLPASELEILIVGGLVDFHKDDWPTGLRDDDRLFGT